MFIFYIEIILFFPIFYFLFTSKGYTFNFIQFLNFTLFYIYFAYDLKPFLFFLCFFFLWTGIYMRMLLLLQHFTTL